MLSQVLPLSQGLSLLLCFTKKFKIPRVLSNFQTFPGRPTAQTHLLEKRQWFSTKKQLSHSAHKGGCRATNLRSVRHSGPFYVSQPHKGAARAVFPSPLLHFCSNKSSPLLVSRRAANSFISFIPSCSSPGSALISFQLFHFQMTFSWFPAATYQTPHAPRSNGTSDSAQPESS